MQTVVFLHTPGPAGILQTPAGPTEIVTQAGSLWISLLNSEIAKVSPATGRLEQQIFVGKTDGILLAGTGRKLWALLQTGSSSPDIYLPDPAQPGRVGLIDPRTGTFQGRNLTIGDSSGYDSFVATPVNAWVGDFENSTVIAIGETRTR
jgi:DNA-binding beta-propeller fold protein YncE